MKITALVLYCIFMSVTLSAEKNWIPIEAVESTKTPEQNTQLGAELSQVEPIKKIMKNAILIKELMDKKEKVNSADDKNWFELKNMEKR